MHKWLLKFNPGVSQTNKSFCLLFLWELHVHMKQWCLWAQYSVILGVKGLSSLKCCRKPQTCILEGDKYNGLRMYKGSLFANTLLRTLAGRKNYYHCTGHLDLGGLCDVIYFYQLAWHFSELRIIYFFLNGSFWPFWIILLQIASWNDQGANKYVTSPK